jgi:hypothetical protein
VGHITGSHQKTKNKIPRFSKMRIRSKLLVNTRRLKKNQIPRFSKMRKRYKLLVKSRRLKKTHNSGIEEKIDKGVQPGLNSSQRHAYGDP